MSLVTITIKEQRFYDGLNDPVNEIAAAPLSYHLHIVLDSNPQQALEAVQSVIYSDVGRIPEPYTIAETHRTIEHGATGSEYEIVIAVMSGLAANLGTELVKGLVAKIAKQPPSKENDARERAILYLVATTELPKRAFELLYSKEEDKQFAFMFLERMTDKKYYLRVSKEFAVIEYRVYGPGLIQEQEI